MVQVQTLHCTCSSEHVQPYKGRVWCRCRHFIAVWFGRVENTPNTVAALQRDVEVGVGMGGVGLVGVGTGVGVMWA